MVAISCLLGVLAAAAAAAALHGRRLRCRRLPAGVAPTPHCMGASCTSEPRPGPMAGVMVPGLSLAGVALAP